MRSVLGRRVADEIRRLLDEPPLRATAPPAVVETAVYTDADRHRGEVAAIRSYPLPAAHASELAEPGSFVTREILGVPLLIVRDAEGMVRALRNACLHRGGIVETAARGAKRIFSCGFHGWSYALDGALRSVSTPERFSSTKCEGALRSVACEERHGIVWLTLDATESSDGANTHRDVRSWLGPELDDELALLGLGEMVCHTSDEFDVAANWKLLTDGFLELYHLKYLHRNSIARYFPADTMSVRRFGPHFSTMLPKLRLLRRFEDGTAEEADVLDGVTMPYLLMPTTVVQWQAGHVELFSLQPHPSQPGRTRCRLQLLVPAARAGETELWDRNWERLVDTIPAEDFAAAADVQRNVDAGSTPTVQFGANEYLIVEHLAAVDALLARPANESGWHD